MRLRALSLDTYQCREGLYRATSAGEQQQLRGARAEEHAAELRRGRDDLRRRLVELGAEQHAAVLPVLEVSTQGWSATHDSGQELRGRMRGVLSCLVKIGHLPMVNLTPL